MIKLHAEILRKGDKKEFVIVPYDEYEKLMEYIEDLEDLTELRRFDIRRCRSASPLEKQCDYPR